MPAYSAVAALQLGEAISASGTDVLTEDVATYMSEGLQFLVNVIPTDMLWSMETADDFVNSSNPASLDIDTNKILYVIRESDSLLIDAGSSGVDTVDDTTPVPSGAWQVSQTHYNVQQTVTLVSGGGATGTGTDIECKIVTDGDGNPTFTITKSGKDYLIDDWINFTDPGDTSNTAAITVATNTTTGTVDDKMLVECREIPAALRGRVHPGSGWKEEVSETDPVWYKLDGKVHILPTSTSVNSKLYWIKVPPTTWALGAESRTYMGGTILFELEPLLLCYVVKRCLEQKLAKVELGTSSSLEAYISDEDLDLVQAQQVLIGDLLQRITLKDKNMQLMLGALMQGTIQQETADDTKRIPAYSGIAE